MKQVFVKLSVKPMSINNAKMPIRMGRTARLADTPDARKYKAILSGEFEKFKVEIEKFSVAHDKGIHALEATWNIYIPADLYFTKKGTISEKCLDATNSIKLMEDALVKVLNIDDSQIIETIVRKIPVSRDSWSVSLELSRVTKPEVVHLDA